MNIKSKTRTTSYTLDEFNVGDVIALGTHALADKSLTGIYYARVVNVGTEYLLLRCDLLKRDFYAPAHFVSHKMISAA